MKNGTQKLGVEIRRQGVNTQSGETYSTKCSNFLSNLYLVSGDGLNFVHFLTSIQMQ